MRQLYPDGGESEIFRTLYLERLPPRIRNAVHSLKLVMPNATSLTLDQIAEYADQQSEGADEEGINVVRSRQPEETLEQMVERILKGFLDKNNGNRGRSMSRGRRSNDRNQQQSEDRLAIQSDEVTKASHQRQPCFYHQRYGNGRHENRSCYPGCSLNQEWLQVRKQREFEDQAKN